MQLNLSREDRRLLTVAAVVFLVCALLAIFLSPEQSQAKLATTYSTASAGAKAAYLLLHESGYHVERWERPPAELGDPRNTVLILTDPTELPTQPDRDGLAKFISGGGVLVLAGDLSSLFVSEAAPVPPPVSLGWQIFPAQAPSPQARNAPEVKLDAVASWAKAGNGIGLYGDESRFTVMQYARGNGRLLWLASSSLLSNAGLRESDNLEFLLSTIGDKSQRVLWDEYFHGRRSSGPVEVTHPQMTWLFAQLAFVALAVLLTFSRRSGPQRAPAAESRLSPLEYVRALGQLYEHAKAANVAVDISYERFRYTLTKRLGLRASATSDELAQAVADRWPGTDREDLRSLLQTCESARFFEDLTQREALALVQRLYSYSERLKLFPAVAKESG
ncbi:MAG TPA: DUF4350 domain-containing protein [Candidatus Binatia bacterium]|nr:DUF4350 domain-containing protein [Candidatus Binatia bacterium]